MKILLFNMVWKQVCHTLINLNTLLNWEKRILNVLTQSLIWNNMLEISTVQFMSHVRFGIEQTWDRTPHSNATDLANHASKIVNLMTRFRPTVCRSVRQSIRQSVRSCADCLSANKYFPYWPNSRLIRALLYTHTSKTTESQCFPLLLWTEVQPVHTPVGTQAYGLVLSQSNFSILSVFCLVYNNIRYFYM